MTSVVSFLPPREYLSTRRPITVTDITVPSDDAMMSPRPSNILATSFKSSHQRKMIIRNIRRSPQLSSSTKLYAQDAASSTSEGDVEEKELTPSAIAELIEVSFLQSCLQLSQGYIDVLKLFIVAVKAGYERSMPLEDLHRLVEDCPVNSAGRDLMKEEKELRLEWMTVIYELLNALDPDSAVVCVDSSDDDATNDRIAEVVNAMLSVRSELRNEEQASGGEKDATVALNNLTVDRALELSPPLSKLNESLSSNPMEKAFLTNDIRVALVTFRVLEEEKVCTHDASGRKSTGSKELPRPPIPGT
eukprot:CAMPEP_0181101594 /NCGR_PEP_ID=MMETSP1071-20121207/13842_1 /TAXON_ID=35127 /ORGANISM="Thalassiosira sp., Strain NH16" /LENGTH=303 /DNA_ID=CAMNT_0023184465 /DNA_START=47 /DNA_END=958 /DNA_ORIENTATION=+